MKLCLAPQAPDTLLPQQKTVAELQAQLQLPLCTEAFPSNGMQLGWQQNRLALFSDPKTAISIDFCSGKLLHRLKFGGGKGQPLAKAVGFHKYEDFSIIDATAGLAGDSFVFASLMEKHAFSGSVTLIERHPVVASLIEDALIRGQQCALPEVQSIVAKMQLHCGAAAELIPQLPAADVIYLDPMYPEKKKKAAVKKGMQALQQLVGPDQDSEILLQAALECALKRVVVKRPKGAPPLKGPQPSASIQSPNTRYDLYIKSAKITI
ncbi:class I SAM-dependent methyltransferase [Galenea microaerophila]